jgi:hypothetical protein
MNMRIRLAPVALTATLLLTSAAFADATSTSTTSTATTAQQPAKTPSPKRLACRASWKAQTMHTGTHKDFMHACMAKASAGSANDGDSSNE